MIKLKFLQSDKKKQRYGISGVRSLMFLTGALTVFLTMVSVVAPDDLIFFTVFGTFTMIGSVLTYLHKSEEIYLFQDYFLVNNSLIFWQPKVRFDLSKISRVVFYPQPEKDRFRITFHLKDGRNRSYNIFDANWEDIINYFYDKGLKLESKV